MSNTFAQINHIKDCRYGKMLYNIHDRYIGKSLDLYGEYCQFEIDIFSHLVHPGDLVIDIGANMGSHTVYLAQQVGRQGGVIAVEPQRVIHQILCANVALNSFTNVYCIQCAVGAKPGAVIIPSIDYTVKANFGAVSLGEYTNGEQVNVIPLDNFRLPRCDFIKIDVEGMEIDALKGAKETIAKYQPILFVENDREKNSKALIDLLFSYGYRLYWALTPYYNPDNFLKNPHNVYSNTMAMNMLCLPKDSTLQPLLTQIESSDDDWKKLVVAGKIPAFDPNKLFLPQP